MTQPALLLSNQSLQAYNTFGIDVNSALLAEFQTVDGLRELIHRYGNPPELLLGGGSNVLLRAPIEGLTCINRIGGIHIRERQGDSVLVEVGGGVNWHQFVLWALEQGFGGVENLALIPGTVGAAPVQNIGAYGVELADVFDHLEALEWQTDIIHEMSAADCRFGYRDSLFKQPGQQHRFCITKVFLWLRQANYHLNTSYGAIRQYLGTTPPSPTAIARAVIAIRQSKLPDWRQFGNAGSFFKNPIVSAEQHDTLKATDPALPAYPQPDGTYKLAAGYLIDRCGWKGFREGAIGCYAQQALVIVNFGGATGESILAFSHKVAASVADRYGVQLEREVRILPI